MNNLRYKNLIKSSAVIISITLTVCVLELFLIFTEYETMGTHLNWSEPNFYTVDSTLIYSPKKSFYYKEFDSNFIFSTDEHLSFALCNKSSSVTTPE